MACWASTFSYKLYANVHILDQSGGTLVWTDYPASHLTWIILQRLGRHGQRNRGRSQDGHRPAADPRQPQRRLCRHRQRETRGGQKAGGQPRERLSLPSAGSDPGCDVPLAQPPRYSWPRWTPLRSARSCSGWSSTACSGSWRHLWLAFPQTASPQQTRQTVGTGGIPGRACNRRSSPGPLGRRRLFSGSAQVKQLRRTLASCRYRKPSLA